MKYKIIGILGSEVKEVYTIDDAVLEVLKQIPISNKTKDDLTNRLQRSKKGSRINIDYGGTCCSIIKY